ncbi:protein-L-isoaspartate(D-aspartate) O-methyltransferase [Acidiluteibacter ferrifornacis]|uniref:Protein-L-isoaspartate O-methyltransferase n=1 Tax=Acidiluteibacter ferrifornacis TaxID=2692424 RepID=A0A6N9NM96_9FLAO|nr:protein-L-isoaspartate(D-aspartate) O-methyltransferase [Acidiluteibacter ferrifornacis]MBR9831194.1 protein-L-isoaspartate(D-aspartate) O-methyltransferase [bacterium]NBG67014.1 protein-L-isoaspartate(D-aspartate) O-methyltransferase [Acidiluteibacter ferrifornacis]
MDTYRHKGLRKKLVELLKEKGITDEQVLEAINSIPRHLFLDNAFVNFAYQDKAFPIGAGQTISQPFTVAFQTQLLELERGDKVLEIGTGSAYQTCVLLEMKAKVFSIERQKLLFQRAKVLLPKMGYSAKLFFGDGYKGQPAFAPFDKIIITAGAPFIPEDLKKQLKVGGIMVIPVGEGESQVMQRLRKIGETEFEYEEFGDFKFVPLLQDKSFSN